MNQPLRISISLVAIAAVAGLGVYLWRTPVVDAAAQARAAAGARASFARLPRAFEANRGQTDAQVKYLARGPGYTLFLTPGKAVLALRTAAPARAESDALDTKKHARSAPGSPRPEDGFSLTSSLPPGEGKG